MSWNVSNQIQDLLRPVVSVAALDCTAYLWQLSLM